MAKKLGNFVRAEEGQNLVEFALLLPLLIYILLGIVQFGFIFAAYVTLNNAVREGARWGSIYVYDNVLCGAGCVASANDSARNDGVVARLIQSRGILSMAPLGSSTANFSTNQKGSLAAASCPQQTPPAVFGFYYGSPTNPDVTICYSVPAGISPNDPRRGYYLDVQAWYHQLVFMPFIDQFLPNDPVKGPQWIRIPARITVVVN